MKFTYLCTISIVFLQASIISAEFSDRNSLTNLQDIELTSSQAVELCKTLNKSMVQDHQLYLWTSVHTDKETEKSKDTFSPECYTIRYKSCAGQPRYPLQDNCGFFTPVQDQNCLLNQRSKRSSAQPIKLTHSTASHLCLGVNNLPTDSPFQLNFVPIKVLLNPTETRGKLTGECIHWVYTECDSDNTDSRKGDCGRWTMETEKDENCLAFSSRFEKFNVTNYSSFPNSFLLKSDFLEGAVTDDAAPAWTTSFLSSIIKCSNKNNNIVCEVSLENKDRRSKRAPTPQTPISRVKRQCCSFANCRPCGNIGLFGPGTDRCDCGTAIDDYCDSDGVCDARLDPTGNCVLCCGADCNGKK